MRPFAQVHVWRHLGQIDPSRWKYFLVWMVKISKHFPRIFQLEREKKNNLFVSTSSRRRWGGGCDDRLVAPCRGVRRRRWGPVFNRIATLIGPGISTARLCSDVSHDLRITFSPKSGRESRPSYLRRRTLFRMKKKRSNYAADDRICEVNEKQNRLWLDSLGHRLLGLLRGIMIEYAAENYAWLLLYQRVFATRVLY